VTKNETELDRVSVTTDRQTDRQTDLHCEGERVDDNKDEDAVLEAS